MSFREQYKPRIQPEPRIVEVLSENFNHLYLALFSVITALALLPLALPRSQSALGQLRNLQSVYLSALMILIAVMIVTSSLYACRQARKLRTNLGKDAFGDACSQSEIHSLLHLVIITVYQEPLDLITLTLESLANQTKARSLAVTIAFEQDSSDLEAKVAAIQLLFTDSFYRLFIFIHPNGLFGETKGKCSNLNYAARSTVAALSKEMTLDFKMTTITSCDADNLFSRKYFEILEFSYLNTPDRLSTMWQAPLVYSWGLDAIPIFTYITGVLRSIWIIGILIPLGLNGMSVFSLSLDLYHRGSYTSPIYQMEDMLSTIRWSILIGSKVELAFLQAPILSGPTSGKDLCEQFTQWRDQITRWTIGAAEVYAYALHYSRHSSLSVSSLARWLLYFFLFYFIVQCAAPVALTIGLVRVSLFDSNLTYAHLFVSDDILASFFRWWLLTLFMINAVVAWTACLLSKGIGIKENVVAAFTKLIFAPPVIALSSLIALVALGRVALYGKAACLHVPSAKGSLPTNIKLH